MNKTYEENILNELLEEDVLESLKDVNGISMKSMAEYALKGPNMASQKTLEAFLKEQTNSIIYTEALTILKYYLKEEDYNKIPKDKIEFFEKSSDSEYKYKIDKTKPFVEQNISRRANTIIVYLYREYFANEEEKRILDQILNLNETNQKKILAYEEAVVNKEKEETALVKIEEDSLFIKIINKIRRMLLKKEKA